MSGFFENARNIFEAAASAAEAGQAPSDLTILIGEGGAIEMVADSDWPLDRLLAHRGARMAFRVGEQGGNVRLEGKSASESCRLQVANRVREALWGLNPVVNYATAAPALPAANTRLLTA